MPQGETTPLHVTLSGDEIIHILEGTMRSHVDGATSLIVTQGGEFELMVCQMNLPALLESLKLSMERMPETTQRFFDTCA